MDDSLHRYETILQKLLTYKDAELSSDDIKEVKALARKLAKKSTRHHYIPQYYIKGFTGKDDKMLSVYDKKTGRISEKRLSSKNVFFQPDRNSVDFHGLKISIIEDHFFSKIDKEFARYITQLRVDPINVAVNSIDNQAMLNAFIIDLFWRNPLTDYAFDNLYEGAKITFPDEMGNQRLDPVMEMNWKSDQVNKKIERSKMTVTSIRDILSNEPVQSTVSKMWEFEHDVFVLGDYPMLFNGVPRTFTDLIALDFYIPVSSNRLYSSNKISGLNFEVKDAHLLNALIIDQSKHTVCSPDRQLLGKSVAHYHALKDKFLLPPLKQDIFNRISGSKSTR